MKIETILKELCIPCETTIRNVPLLLFSFFFQEYVKNNYSKDEMNENKTKFIQRTR